MGAPSHSIVAHTLVATAGGTIGLAWSRRGLLSLQLSADTVASTLARLTRGLDSVEAEPPPWLEPTIARLQLYFCGEPVDLSGSPLDLGDAPDFFAHVYAEMLTLRWGETVTYGELARRVGAPGAARAVGQAMHRNTIPVIIPCHRVLASGGKTGGFSAPGGVTTKLKLLEMEGVRLGRPDAAQLELAL